MRSSCAASKTVVMSAMRNLRKRCPGKPCHVQKPAVAAVRNTAFIQLMCGLYSDSGTLPRKLRAKLRNLEGLAGAKDLMVRSMRLRNHIGVELTDPNLRLSGF
jgi:hypothetical protein